MSILFIVYSLSVGGVEKSLINLLAALPTSIDISILTMEKKGEFLKDLPSNVKILESSLYKNIKWIINNNPYYVIKRLFLQRKIIYAIQFLFFCIYRRITRNTLPLYEFLFKNEQISEDSYDVVVAYAGPSTLIDFFAVRKIKAPQKIGWVHFDILKSGVDKNVVHRLFQEYSKIFVVSKEAKEHFDMVFPELKVKTELFYNIVSPLKLYQQAVSGESFIDDFIGVRILTVGRICREKGQDYAIEALNILIHDGYRVKWYFVGDGPFRAYCEDLVHKYNLENSVVFLGTKKNPYSYMKDCDIYVQPSRYEGYCITLAEAKVFGNPIVSTAFVGANEQLEGRMNSIVVGFSVEDLVAGILQALKYKRIPLQENLNTLTDLNIFLSALK